MSLYLYGVIEGEEPVQFGPIGFEGTDVRTFVLGGLGVVIGAVPQKGFSHLHKEEIISLLLEHQQTLESVMKQFFVLPFKFGTTLRDEVELSGILERSVPRLRSMIGQMKGAVEIDLIATWDVRTMLQEISEEDPEIAACKRQMAQNQADPSHIGKLLAEGLKRRAAAWVQKIAQSLTGSVVASAGHDLRDDAMILNSSYLVSMDREKQFFHLLEEVDRLFGGKLHFKCVGPLPPYSFATMTLKRFDPGEIEAAAALLHLQGNAELSRVKKVYKELSRSVHPDHNSGASTEPFERLSKAYELLADYCKEGMRPLGKEAVGRYIRLDPLGQQGES